MPRSGRILASILLLLFTLFLWLSLLLYRLRLGHLLAGWDRPFCMLRCSVLFWVRWLFAPGGLSSRWRMVRSGENPMEGASSWEAADC